MEGTTKIENLGTVNFTQTDILGSIEMYIDVVDLPEDLTVKINKAVDESKATYIQYHESIYKELGKEYSEQWGASGVVVKPQLHVCLSEDARVQYELSIYYEDIDNPELSNSVSIDIDLGEYKSQIKELFIRKLLSE